MKPIKSKTLEVVRIFDSLPDAAAVSVAVGEVVTGLNAKTLRNHPQLSHVRLSQNREGLGVASLRQLLRGEPVAA